MCTAVSMIAENREVVMGRTMDFTVLLDAEIHAFPAGYGYNGISSDTPLIFEYGLIGAARNIMGRIIFADAVNEKGLAGGSLYFPGYAYFEDVPSTEEGVTNLAAIEFMQYCLGTCADTDEVKKAISNLVLVGVMDPLTKSVAPLHWIFTDRNGKCIVVEKMEDGFHVHDNKMGVLANSPNFEWHLTNLRNYLNLDIEQIPEVQWGQMELRPFGQGGGSLGLPGDYTPPARFVKAAFQKTYITKPRDGDEAILAGYHVLDGVAVPHGIVYNVNHASDYTQYIAMMNLSTSTYYYTTYSNREIKKIKYSEISFEDNSSKLIAVMEKPISFYNLLERKDLNA